MKPILSAGWDILNHNHKPEFRISSMDGGRWGARDWTSAVITKKELAAQGIKTSILNPAGRVIG